MVLVAGARQVGKTTLALGLVPSADESHPCYMNWDNILDREMILSGLLPLDQPLVIYDEIHKYPQWRNLLKGLYDKNRSRRGFVVTGSARLDDFSRGGDSLQGRYHLYRLHPYSVGESGAGQLGQLMEFGGFPEPFHRGDKDFWRRWQNEKLRLVLRDDLDSLAQVREVEKVSLLASLLPRRVGSPLSIQNLRQDLDAAHESVARWIGILESLYYCYRIAPFGFRDAKAVKKEQKLYLWDWSLVPDPAHRF